jgi:hypothetical protein
VRTSLAGVGDDGHPIGGDLELIRLVDANLVAFGRFMGRLTADRATEAEAAVVLPAAATFFGRRGHGHGIWTRAHADAALEAVLPAAGFACAVDLPVMVREGRPAEFPGPAGALVRRVTDEAGVADFRAVDLAGFAADEHDEHERAAVEWMFASPRSLVEPEVAGFVAYVEGAPAAAAMSFTDGAVTRVGWVGTVPAHRRRGLGAAVTGAAVLAGFDLGARLAALESSVAGEPFHLAMGFRAITRYRVWTSA